MTTGYLLRRIVVLTTCALLKFASFLATTDQHIVHDDGEQVSTVYGPARTLRHASQEVRHLLTGTRYNVYRSDPQTHKSVPDSLLPAALNEGACLIDAFLDNLPGEAGITEVVHTRQVNGAPVMTGKPTSRATVRCRPD